MVPVPLRGRVVALPRSSSFWLPVEPDLGVLVQGGGVLDGDGLAGVILVQILEVHHVDFKGAVFTSIGVRGVRSGVVEVLGQRGIADLDGRSECRPRRCRSDKGPLDRVSVNLEV